MGKSRILVLQLKEIIYTAIFLLFGILLILVMVILLSSKDNAKETISNTQSIYNPGVYTSELTIGESVVSLELTLDENAVKSLKITNMDDSVKKIYPLLESTVSEVENELKSGKSLNDITYSSNSKYTKQMIVNSINEALNKAKK